MQHLDTPAPGYYNKLRRTTRPVVVLLVMALIVLATPALFGRPYVPAPFGESALAQFELTEAETVFIGNSLLDTRIDPKLFEELTGNRTESLAIDGIGPGIWYLQIKNIVTAVSDPPQQVFIFFHDDLLTRNVEFTGPEDHRLAESLTRSGKNGDAAVARSSNSWRNRVVDAFRAVYPISRNTHTSEPGFIGGAGASITGLTSEELETRSDSAFSFANRRDQSSVVQQPKFHGDFQSKIGDSYLPAMIVQADRSEIDLTIVRVAARPNANGDPNESTDLANYSADLEAYLFDRDVRFIDMVGHVENGFIDAGMYYDGFHLKHRFRSHYTEFFAEWLLADQGHPSSEGTP